MRSHPNSGHVVYFIRAEGVGLIKIGAASCIHKRLATLRSMSPVPLELLGVLRIAPRSIIEQMMHGRFAHLRSHGEWFREADDLLEFIRSEAVEAPEKPRFSMAERKLVNAKRRARYYARREQDPLYTPI